MLVRLGLVATTPFMDLGVPVHLWGFCVSGGKLAVYRACWMCLSW